jgi:peptide/nickel transport system substrate-binding protein
MFIDEARLKHLYDGLFEVDSSMTPVPRLASAAEPNADGTRWLLTLRDARWHDGSALTADDVLFTLSRILGPQTETAPFVAATTLGQVDLSGSRAVGTDQVELALKTPSFDFPALLTSYGTRVIHDGTTDISRPNGTGAYRFESFTPGQRLVLTRYDDHWDTETAGADGIGELRLLSSTVEARVNALRSGQADFIDNVSPTALRTLSAQGGLETAQAPNSGILYFAMKCDRPPFDDPDVRRAMMRLVDRDELVKVALEGDGEVADDVFGRGYRYYADDLPTHTYDPDEAARLLERAGARDLAFDLYVAPVANGFPEAAELLRQQAARAGVRVTVVTGSKDTYYTEALKTGDMAMGQSGPLAIPYHFGSRLLTDSSKNITHWYDAEFDQLYAQAQQTADEEQRTAVYHRMHEMLHDRGGYIFWATTSWNTAHRTGLSGAPNGTVNGFDWARFTGVTA